MPAITYKDFDGGLDRRLPIGVQDANRLWTLQNAYITSGKKIAKRPALKAISGSLAPTSGENSCGLFSINGQLRVYVPTGSLYSFPTQIQSQTLTPPVLSGLNAQFVDVVQAVVFNGFEYVVAKWRDVLFGDIVYRHHYLDGSGIVTDANCPQSASITVAASRIFAIDGEVVRYCAAGNPKDWTTASDAGFLPVSLQQNTTAECTAVGTFEDALVVFFDEGMQIWDVAVDPSANQIRRRLYASGTTRPHSLAGFYRDLVFVSPYGARSLSVQENVERLDETDVGVQIDSVLVPALAEHDLYASTSAAGADVRGIWLQQLGQYWIVLRSSTGAKVFAYSFSRSSKLACWSVYTFPIAITDVAARAGKVSLRSTTTLYEFDAATFTDSGVPIDVDVQMAFQDAKLPGVEKMFYGADYVFSGTADVSYLYDPRDTTKETNAQAITGDTRTTTIVPVEVSSAALAPRFQHSADEAFSIDMLTLYFHSLSATAS